MISDTLSQAASQIRRYLNAYPAFYADRPLIQQALAAMDAARADLDLPPEQEIICAVSAQVVANRRKPQGALPPTHEGKLT